jgi:hypothetical protein
MKKSVYKQATISKETFVDIETSEILSEVVKKHGYMANTKEEFLFIYASILGIFEQFEQSEIRVYAYLLRYAGDVMFSIDKPLRKHIGEITSLAERTVYNTIQSLKAKNLIYENEGLYMINPRYAFKGSTSDRNNALKAIIEVGCKDC